MEISYFDLVAGIIILLLGLKGILNGLFKEVFGLIGLVGGAFIGSRVATPLGTYMNDLIFNFESAQIVSAMGFFTAFALFWGLMIAVGLAFKKLSSLSGLGPVDKILGFVFGASKFFFIAAVIAHAVYSINAVRTTLDSALKNSILFPIMVETGAFIIKMDPVNMSEDLNATITEGTEALKQKTQEIVEESAQDQIDEIKEQLKEEMQKQAKEK